MTRDHNRTEIVRLSVGNWIVILLFLAAAVGALLRSQAEFGQEVRHRLTRVESRVDQVWELVRPADRNDRQHWNDRLAERP